MRALLAILLAVATPALAQVSPAALAEQAILCAPGAVYPPMPAGAWVSVPSATSGTPRIDQYRAGKLIATYATFSDTPSCQYRYDGLDWQTPSFAAQHGCGPFTRSHSNRLWMPHDTFLVWPAVYSGPYDQPYLGAESTTGAYSSAGVTASPDDVTIRGLVRGGVRPVLLLTGYAGDNTIGQSVIYAASGARLRITDLNVMASAGASVGKAGVYLDGVTDPALSDMRIGGFQNAGPGYQGLFSTPNIAGTLTGDGLELDHNGGPNGPAHNAYIDASAVDPNFAVVLTHSFSHHAVYGHEFKTRAQNGRFSDDVFQGSLPQPGQAQAEAYLLDISNGGRYVVENSVFDKTASGPGSNGTFVTFDVEGLWDTQGAAGPSQRPQSLVLRNNLLRAWAKTFDGSHLLVPLALDTPAAAPPIHGQAIAASDNTYAGFCPQGGPADYRAGSTIPLAAAALIVKPTPPVPARSGATP